MPLFALLFILLAHAEEVVVDLLGQSNALGYAVPFGGTVIPANVTYVRNGVLRTTYDPTKSGIEVGLGACLVSLGYEPTIVVQATNGMAAAAMRDTRTPSLIADAGAWGAPDAVVIIHGEQDSAALGTARDWDKKVFGPEYQSGYGITAVDTSVAGQLRRAFGEDLPLVVTELRLPAPSVAYPFPNVTRARQHVGCAEDRRCWLLQTQTVQQANDQVHYSSQGFWDLGWDTCELIVTEGILPTSIP